MLDFLHKPEPEFVFVCKRDDLIEGSGREFIINETEVALYLVNGQVFALHNVCTHQHRAILHEGFIEDGCVVCPAHAWQFRLRDGKQPDGRRGVDCYPVELRDDEVYVKVSQKRFCF